MTGTQAASNADFEQGGAGKDWDRYGGEEWAQMIAQLLPLPKPQAQASVLLYTHKRPRVPAHN